MMNGVGSPTTTGGEDTAITTTRPASGGARGGLPRGGDNHHGRRGNNNNNNNNKAWNPVIIALAAASALSLQITGTCLCDDFVTVQAQPGELLAIVRTSRQEAQTQTSLGIFGRGDFYALSAYHDGDDTDFMWKLARIFGAVSLALGGLATLTAWATTIWSPTLTPKWLAACPTTRGGSVWTVIAAAGAMAALLQVPTFLVLEAYPCTDFTRQQTCHLSLGSYLTMASVVAWIVVTALTQLLDPPEWTRNLEQWRVVLPKNHTAGSTQKDEDDNVDESSTSEDDDVVLHQVEEGREISGIPDDVEEDDDDSQDPIFSPRPRESGSCLVSSSPPLSSSSFWDRLLPWRSSTLSTSPRKPWQRCVKSKSSSSNRHLNRNGTTTSVASQSHRVVQRFSSTPSYNRKSNNSNPAAALHLPESSFLVEEAVESSLDESTITFESLADEDRGRQQLWTKLAQDSSFNHDDMGQPQARGLVDPDLQRHRHVLVDQQAQRVQQAPPPVAGTHYHHYSHYPIQVLHGSSEWDKPEGIVPAEESLTASSFRTSSSGRDSPITGDESILDKDEVAAAKHDCSASSSSSSSSSVAESQQGSSALNSQDEEQVKAVAVSGVPIYKDLLAEDEKKLNLNDYSVQQQKHQAVNLRLLGDSANAGEDADDEHDDLEESNNNNQLSSSSGALRDDSFFSELPGTSTIRNNGSSTVGAGAGYNFLDLSSNTNMTNNTTNSAHPRFLGVGLLSSMAAFRVRGVANADAYYPFENDDDDEDYDLMQSSNYARGPPISEVQIFNHSHIDVEDAACGVSSIMEDSLLDTIHPVSSSSEQELLQTWNDLFDFDDPHHTTLEDYRQESFVTSLEEDVSTIGPDDRLKTASIVIEANADAHALADDERRQQHPPRFVRGETTEQDENRKGRATLDSSNSAMNARDLKRRQVIAAVVRRTNGGGGGVTLRPRRQHRRGRHTSDSVSSATSLLSFTIEEETARDLMEEGGSGDLDGDDNDDYDKNIIDCARRVKQSIPLCRTQSLPYPATNSSVVSDDGDGNTRPRGHRAASLPSDRLVTAQDRGQVVQSQDRGQVVQSQDRGQVVQSQTEKDQQQQHKDDDQHVDDEEDSIDHKPIPMQRRRSRSLEVRRKKSSRRTESRSLSPDCSLEESSTRKSNKNLWRLDREARSSIHNVPVISLSESSDDDNAADIVGSMTTLSNKIAPSDPNRARLARIQRLQREREQQQQQSKDRPGTQDPPLTPLVQMDDTTDASSDVVDDTTIETLEPLLSHDQGRLLLHRALTPPRRGSSSRGSGRSVGDDSVASSVDGNESYLNTLEVSLAQLQRDDEMEYGPDENSI